MKQVAAAKIRRAEHAAASSRARTRTRSAEMLRDLHGRRRIGRPSVHEARQRDGAPAGVILMTADKGLAGAFNSNLIRVGRALSPRATPTSQWYTVGIKGAQRRAPLGARDRPTWPLTQGDQDSTPRAKSRSKVSDDFVAGKISQIMLISPKLISMMSQKPETRKLLPIVAPKQPEHEEPSGPRRRGRVRAVARGRALAAASEVSRVHDLLGDARDRRGVLRRAARRDEQRDRQRHETDRRTHGRR